MKKVKDFTYYGIKRSKVQRILRAMDEESRYNWSLLYTLITFVLVALCINLEQIFNVDLGIVGGAISTIFIGLFIWYLGNVVTYVVCKYLNKYYWSKRVELFNKYVDEKKAGKKNGKNL